MKKILFSLLLTVVSTFCFAQQHSAPIAGQVQDENGQPVPFATVQFMSSDTASKFLSEKIADEKGQFKVSLPQREKYWLKASGISFQELTTWVHPDSAGLKVVLEKKQSDLATVTVNSTRPLITRKIDRIVMDVENNALTAGKSSMDIMEMAPGMFVDRNGGISINGNSGTRIMINGKMLHLSGDDLTAYLNNLRAADIKSIEIIAHPSAEFDAEGSGGIINIILKKKRTAGLSGSVNAGYSQGRYAGNDQGLQLNYNKSKVTLSSSYSRYQDRRFNDITQERTFPENGIYTAANNIINHYNGNSIRVGGTYDISDQQYIGLEYAGSFNISGSNTHSISNINYPQNESESFVSDGNFTDHNARNLHDVTLNYHLDTDTSGSKFDFTADYTFTNNNSSNLSQSQDLDMDHAVIRDSAFRFAMPNKAMILTADAKYQKVFTPVTKLNLGAKYTGTRIDNFNRFYSVTDDKWQENPAKKYTYHYNEHIMAGFMSLETKILQTEFQLGLRGEYTDTKGELVSLQHQKIDNQYFNLFPSVFIKRNLNESGDNYLNFSYNRRIERPYYNDLNPFVSYLDNYTLESGNPFLRPQFSNNFEIGFTLKNKYNLSVGYNKDIDVITQITNADPDTSMIEITRGNAGYNERYIATLSLPVQVTKWWKTNNTLQFRHDKIHAETFTIQKPIYFIQTAHDFTLSKTWSANLNAFYLSNVIEGNILVGNISKVDIGIQKKLLDNRLQIRAGLTDLFEGRNITADIKYNDNNIHITQKRQSRMFKLSLTYNFQSGKSFKTKKIQSSSEDVQSRLQ